jgi:hypothetical protein
MDAPQVAFEPDTITLFLSTLISVKVFRFSSLFLEPELLNMVISISRGSFPHSAYYRVLPIIIVIRTAASLIGYKKLNACSTGVKW